MAIKKLKTKKQHWFHLGKKAARILVVTLCTGGFTYQTIEFLLLYWTYPTVVDIQEISPSFFEMPTFTICNTIGYNFDAICNYTDACVKGPDFKQLPQDVCEAFTNVCEKNSIPVNFTGIFYSKFLRNFTRLPVEYHEKIRQKLEDYLRQCKIDTSKGLKNCSMDSVMGSFYSNTQMQQYCFSLFSLWGKPFSEREQVAKGTVMRLLFNLNATRRSDKPFEYRRVPLFNLPADPQVHISVNSPYFLPSPFLEGQNFQGGRNYIMRVIMKETHLLPAPYQTNCTNYMEEWKKTGGYGPINQLGVVQACRADKYYQTVGCVPISVDYPHTHPICGEEISKNQTVIKQVAEDECTMLADSYNQPCSSITYEVEVEPKDIVLVKNFQISFLNKTERVQNTIPYHDCSGTNVWKVDDTCKGQNRNWDFAHLMLKLVLSDANRIKTYYPKCCSIINIDVVFDTFRITNLSYNPKFESLELFSGIGGYMGMWLGISLVAIYDFLGTVLSSFLKWTKKRRQKKRQLKIRQPFLKH